MACLYILAMQKMAQVLSSKGLIQIGSMDSTSIRCDGSRKLLFLWACGTTDFVTDILFLVNGINDHSYPYYRGGFIVACVCSLVFIVLLHTWKLIATFQVIMSEKGASSLESRLVNLANSPGLFFHLLLSSIEAR